MTRTGTARSRQAASTASTIAEPDMSVFMASMPSAGLMSSPPVSKVMPLPTRTTRGVFAVAPSGSQSSWTSRGGVAEPAPTASRPPKPSRRRSASDQTRTSSPLRRASVRACAAIHAGFLMFDGVTARLRATIAARALVDARRTASASVAPASVTVPAGAESAGVSLALHRGGTYPPMAKPSTSADTASAPLPAAMVVSTCSGHGPLCRAPPLRCAGRPGCLRRCPRAGRPGRRAPPARAAPW